MRKIIGFCLIVLSSLAYILLITLANEFSFLIANLVNIAFCTLLPIGLILIVFRRNPSDKNRVKNILFVVSIGMIITAMIGKYYHVPPSAAILFVGTLLYCFGFAPLELKSKYRKWHPFTKNRTESFLLSSADFIGYTFFFIFILLKLNHWPAAKEILITAVVAFGLGLYAWNFIFKKEVVKRKESEERIKEQYNDIQDSIKYAKRIQTAILPSIKQVNENLKDYFIVFKPKDIVAGDFYWLEMTADKLLFAAGDCTGHGVPGAIVSVICNNGLNRAVREFALTDPGKVLDKTREIIVHEFEKSEEDVKDGMDIALCSLEGHKLQYAGANNPLWIVSKGAEELKEIKADKQPVGRFNNPAPYTTHNIDLKKGDTIYLFSDGFADQFGGPSGKKFKYRPLRELLLSISDLSMDKQKSVLERKFIDWKGDLDQVDDVIIFGVRVE